MKDFGTALTIIFACMAVTAATLGVAAVVGSVLITRRPKTP